MKNHIQVYTQQLNRVNDLHRLLNCQNKFQKNNWLLCSSQMKDQGLSLNLLTSRGYYEIAVLACLFPWNSPDGGNTSILYCELKLK